MRLIPKLFAGHVLGDATLWSTSFVSQSPGTIADQWECEATSAGKSFGISIVTRLYLTTATAVPLVCD